MTKDRPIVLQLQDLASDSSNSLTDVLRRALLISSKLGLNDFRKWVENELNGYMEPPVPEYRKVNSEVKAYNPYHGLIQFMVHAKLAEIIQPTDLSHSVQQFESWLKTEKNHIALSFHPMQEEALINLQSGPIRLRPVRVIGLDQISAILNAIRNRLLEWSINLEEQGILGEDMTFSKADKEKAENTPSINIANFQGILGDVSGGTVSQSMSMTIHSGDFESLAKYLKNEGISEQDVTELKNAIQKDPKLTKEGRFGTHVNSWIVRMVGMAASGSWNVSLGAAGNILAMAIGKYYGI